MPTHLLTGIFGMNWQDAAPQLISTPSSSSLGPVGPVGPVGVMCSREKADAEDGRPVVPGLGVMEESRGYYLFWGCPAAGFGSDRGPGFHGPG